MKLFRIGHVALVLMVVNGVSLAGDSVAANTTPQSITELATIAAPGSLAPKLSSGADGSIVLSWIEPDGQGHALRYSSLMDGTWSDVQTAASGNNWFVNWADIPSVVPISDSLWAAHWLVNQEDSAYAYDVHTAVSVDSGNTWSESIIPHSDNTNSEHGFVTLFANHGEVGIAWLDGRNMINEYDETDKRGSGMTLRAADFDRQLALSNEALIDDLTCDCCQTDVALSSDGPVAIYRDRSEDEIRDIYASRQVEGEWQPGYAVAEDHWRIDACPVNGPVIKADGSTVAAAWFTAPNNSPRINVAWSDDAGRSFEEPIEVSVDRPLGHVGATLLAQGDLALSWLRSKGRGRAELMLSRITRAGQVGQPHVLEEAADVFAFSVPQLSRYGDSLVVAWTTAVHGTYGVASALVPTDIFTAAP